MPELAHGVYSDNPEEGPFVIFPTHAHQILSNVIHILGCSILACCFARRTENDQFLSRSWWTNLTWARLLVILVFLDSWFFLAFSGILVNGVGLSVSIPVCSLGIFACIFFYAGSKGLIYLFLVERVWVVCSAGKTITRWQSRIYRACAIIAFGYIGIVAVMIIGRITEIRETDGACVIGLENIATIPLISYDFFVNVLLTSLFLWYIYREKRIGIRLRLLARRTAFASVVALATSGVNVLVLLILSGRQLGWVCLGSCATDVTVNAVVLYWVTAPPRPISPCNSPKPPPVSAVMDANDDCVCLYCMLNGNSSNSHSVEAGVDADLEACPRRQVYSINICPRNHPDSQTYTCSKCAHTFNNSSWRWPWEPLPYKETSLENNLNYDTFRNPIASYEFRFPWSFIASTTHSRSHSQSLHGFDHLPEEAGLNHIESRTRSRSLSLGRLVEEYLGRGADSRNNNHENSIQCAPEKDITDAYRADLPSSSLLPVVDQRRTTMNSHRLTIDIDVDRDSISAPPHSIDMSFPDEFSSVLEFRRDLGLDSDIDLEEPESPSSHETHGTVGSQSRLMVRRDTDEQLELDEPEALHPNANNIRFPTEDAYARWRRMHSQSRQSRSASTPPESSGLKEGGVTPEAPEVSSRVLHPTVSSSSPYINNHLNCSTSLLPSASASAIASSSTLNSNSRCSSFPLSSTKTLAQALYQHSHQSLASSRSNGDHDSFNRRHCSNDGDKEEISIERHEPTILSSRSVDSIFGLGRFFTKKISVSDQLEESYHASSSTPGPLFRRKQNNSPLPYYRPSTSSEPIPSFRELASQERRDMYTRSIEREGSRVFSERHYSATGYDSNDPSNSDSIDSEERRYRDRYQLQCYGYEGEQGGANTDPIRIREKHRLKHARSDSWAAGMGSSVFRSSEQGERSADQALRPGSARSADLGTLFHSQNSLSL